MTSQTTATTNQNGFWQNMSMWFLITVVAGVLPFVFRYLLFISKSTGCEYFIYDVKDAVNFGLAINISNFSLTISRSFNSKPIVLTISGLFGIVLAYLTGVTGFWECSKPGLEGKSTVDTLTWWLVVSSIIISGIANYNVYKET